MKTFKIDLTNKSLFNRINQVHTILEENGIDVEDRDVEAGIVDQLSADVKYRVSKDLKPFRNTFITLTAYEDGWPCRSRREYAISDEMELEIAYGEVRFYTPDHDAYYAESLKKHGHLGLGRSFLPFNRNKLFCGKCAIIQTREIGGWDPECHVYIGTVDELMEIFLVTYNGETMTLKEAIEKSKAA